MSALKEAEKLGIINGNAPLMVKHLLWACSMFVGIIAFGVWFGIWYVTKENEKSVAPLQTKAEAKSQAQEVGKNREDWIEKDWKPHIKESADEAKKANRERGILLDRTDSKARNTNSVGRNNIEATSPPPNE